MPIWITVRIGQALLATFGLLFNVRVMRALPWSYIRTLPRTSAFTGIATASLAVGLGALLPVAVLAPDTAQPAYVIGMSALVVGIGSSWVRWVLQWHRLRRG
jgi:hypothetical protein